MCGSLLPPAFGITEPTPSDAAGFHIFHGDGTGADIVTFRLGGVLPPPFDQAHPLEVPISYTVNPNCTDSYTVLIPDGPSFALFIAPDGESIVTIATDPPGKIRGLASLRGCHASSKAQVRSGGRGRRREQ